MRFLDKKKSAKAHHPGKKPVRVQNQPRNKTISNPDAGTHIKSKWYPNRGS